MSKGRNGRNRKVARRYVRKDSQAALRYILIKKKLIKVFPKI